MHKRGMRVGGLLRYLYGPGKREEHTHPRLVAAWDGAGDLADLEPAVTAMGGRDFRHLVDLLEMPVRAGRNPPKLPVWHCSIRTHPSDPLLSDEVWGQIAAELVARVGLAPVGDERAVRWVAVRHGDDHIHVVATLVRQDRRTVWPRHDYALSQATCRDVEQRLGLYRVGAPGQGSRSWPTPAEASKAARLGRAVPARERLRRLAREAATVAVDEQDFFTRLHRAGVRIRLRHSSRDPRQVTGYSVALDGDITAAGVPVYFSGGKLAAELSLPRLRTRWAGDTSLSGARSASARRTPAPADVYARAAELLAHTAHRIRASADDPAAVTGTVRAVADILAASASAWEGTRGGPLTRAAQLFDRAAHDTSRPATPARTGSAGYQLRALGRLITLMGETCGHRETTELMRLVLNLAGLAETLADLREAHGRLHQAHAARAAAAQLHLFTPPTPGPHALTTTTPARPSRDGVRLDPAPGVEVRQHRPRR